MPHFVTTRFSGTTPGHKVTQCVFISGQTYVGHKSIIKHDLNTSISCKLISTLFKLCFKDVQDFHTIVKMQFSEIETLVNYIGHIVPPTPSLFSN